MHADRSVPTAAVPGPRLVAAGDWFGLLLVLCWGYVSHHGLAGLLRVAELAEAIGPFLLGFGVAALLLGGYGVAGDVAPADDLRTVLVAWYAGAGIGLVIRSAPEIEGGATWPFGLVVLGTGTLALTAWRLVLYGVRRHEAS